MKEINLVRKRNVIGKRKIVIGKIMIDDEDYERFSKFNWWSAGAGYASRSGPGGKGIYLHRELLQPPAGLEVDHINGNKLDNRRCNLRLCTRSQNLCNTRVRSDNKSGHRGVSWSKQKKRFMAKIWKNGKSFHLGSFRDIESAIAAYEDRAKEMFGEFRKISAPEKPIELSASP